MTEEELILFLEKRHRTLETIQSILEGTSVLAVYRQAAARGENLLSPEEAEKVACRWRRDIVESINVLESGGAVWDEPSQTFLQRSDFFQDP